jgi:hypothetical protein
MLANRKTKSCRALIAFCFLKLNLFAFKGKLIMDRLHEVLAGQFSTWVWADMARLSIADFSSFRRLSMNWRSISESSVLSNRR